MGVRAAAVLAASMTWVLGAGCADGGGGSDGTHMVQLPDMAAQGGPATPAVPSPQPDMPGATPTQGAAGMGAQAPTMTMPPGQDAPDDGAATTADAGTPDAGLDAGASDADASEADAATEADAGGGDTTTGLCDPPAGARMTVNATIIVPAGQTFDGLCQRYVAGPAVGDGSQSESQDPVFRLEDGARLVNVVLGSPAADGIHTYGDVALANITWEDIGEDALTIKAPGTVELDGGAAYDGSDKVFQINAASTFRVSNFRADNAGKFIRQNGGTTFRVDVFIDRCDISNMQESIFRTDSGTSTVTMTNTRYSNIGNTGDRLWYDVNPANVSVSGNSQY